MVSVAILHKQTGMTENVQRVKSPIAWVPSLYVAMGIPFSLVIWVAGTMFKDLGHSDTEIALATGSVGIAWSLKPLWASFLDMYRTKKFWVLSMEILIALLLALVAGALPLPQYFRIIIGILWVLAFASSTQDICADGVYITTLDKSQQAKWIGWQGAAWNTGRIFATALVVYSAASSLGWPAPPIQYIVTPCGLVCEITFSAAWRRPRRHTLKGFNSP